MILDAISITQLRVFECVYRTKSMTASARELHLTQSGVSQHVKAIESRLGILLFDRIRTQLFPTQAAENFYPHCISAISGLEAALIQVSGSEKALSGTVRVGMPVEFGNNRVIPVLADFSRQYPDVRFEIRYGIAVEFASMLLGGTLDFALIDDFRLDSEIRTEAVADEVIHLCVGTGSGKKIKTAPAAQDARFFGSLPYVDYDSKASLLRAWFKHHHPELKIKIALQASGMDARGVAKMIMSGDFAGILPDHLVAEFQGKKASFEVISSRKTPLRNTMSLAFLEKRTLSSAAVGAMVWLKKSLA